MTHEDILLKPLRVLGGDGDVAQGPEPGGDAVYDPFFLHPALDQGTGFGHASFSGSGHVDLVIRSGNRHQVIDRNFLFIQKQWLGWSWIFSACIELNRLFILK
jgi:hypothetical protein